MLKKFTNLLTLSILLGVFAFNYANAAPLYDDNSVDTNSQTTCLTISRNLARGNTGDDVTSLQDFLRSQSYFKDQSSLYFGALTEKALLQFQNDHGLEGVGYVGPKTISLIHSMTCRVNSTDSLSPFPFGCSSSYGFSATTGGRCDGPASLFPSGCISSVGFSPNTGEPCNGSNPISPQLLPGCSSASTYNSITNEPCDDSPIITSLIATPPTVMLGLGSQLTFGSLNTKECTGLSSPSSLGVSASVPVSPTGNTTYTVTCRNYAGRTVSKSITVYVTTPTSTSIDTFTGPSHIKLGQPIILNWRATGESKCSLSYQVGSGYQVEFQGVNSKEGPYTVSPDNNGYPKISGNINYIITCSNPSLNTNVSSKNVTVSVSEDPSLPYGCRSTSGYSPSSGELCDKKTTKNPSITAPENPTISSISAASAAVGDEITIFGANFDQDTRVNLAFDHGTVVIPTYISPSIIKFIVPEGLTLSSVYNNMPYTVLVGEKDTQSLYGNSQDNNWAQIVILEK